MRKLLVTGACLLSFIVTHAMAQTCPASTRLSGSAIRSIILGKYVCVGLSPTATSNELHAGGLVIDYKKGPDDLIDPSTVVGSYTIAPSPNGGVITYDYGASGGTYSYHMQPAGGDHYHFCPVGGTGQAVTVSVRPNHC